MMGAAGAPDPLAAIERCVDDWNDLVHSIRRTREHVERVLRSGDAVLDAINAHNARAGLDLPPVPADAEDRP